MFSFAEYCLVYFVIAREADKSEQLKKKME